jgi:hypothetical protein
LVSVGTSLMSLFAILVPKLPEVPVISAVICDILLSIQLID